MTTFSAVNKAAVAMFGMSSEAELLQYGPKSLSPEFQPDGRESVEKGKEMLELALKNGTNVFEWKHIRKNGEEFDCAVSLTVVTVKGRQLIQASMRDITESKRAKELLLQKEKELEHAERVAKIGRWKWDVLKDKVEWSDNLKEIFGVDIKDDPPPYEEFAKVYTPESLKRLSECVGEALEKGTPYQLDLEIILPDGSTKWIQGRGEVTKRDASGRVLMLSGTVQDITERKVMENELHAALRARDLFLGVASHELKTPLTTLQLQIHSLNRILNDRSKEIQLNKIQTKLAIIKKQGERFEELVKSLLDISQINSGKLRLRIEEDLNLSLLAEEISLRFRDEFESVGSEFRINIEPDVKGDWDSQRLDQIISNLLSNALKYGAGKPVEMSVKRTESKALIMVSDQGIGIAEVNKNKIFERFERAVDEHSFKGLGLGLWIVREILNGFGGKVWVESELGKGSRFITELPLKSGDR